MNEFRALVEKSGVVLVTFDHKIFRIVQTRALSEIFRESANEITRFAAGLFHDPDEQRRSGCFAMRPGDNQIVPAAQKIISQYFRQRKVKQFSPEHRLHFGIAALHGVADRYDVSIWWNIFGAITFLQRDPLLLQENRHRRINIFIRTGDREAALLQRCRDRSHGRSANPDEMKFLRSFLHATLLRQSAENSRKRENKIFASVKSRLRNSSKPSS